MKPARCSVVQSGASHELVSGAFSLLGTRSSGEDVDVDVDVTRRCIGFVDTVLQAEPGRTDVEQQDLKVI